MKKIILIGDSGHAKVIEDIVSLLPELQVFAKLDDKYDSQFNENNIIKGPIRCIAELLEKHRTAQVVIAIGSNHVRKRIVERLQLQQSNYATLIHPTAIISSNANIGHGTVVMPNAIINADSIIGNHSIINSGSIIEHDCYLEDFVHVSPAAVLTGNVTINEGTHVGAGASVIPSISIGKWTTIGAGAAVVSDVMDMRTVVGVPAKEI